MLGDVLWSPSPDSGAAMRRWIEASGSSDFAEAHSASVSDLDSFWSWAWDESGVVGESGERAFEPGAEFLEARFFPQARLNVVDTLLAGPEDDEVLVGVDEIGNRRSWTRGRLRAEVASVAHRMRDVGIEPGDRVAAWAPNVPEVVIWALAALSIGAVVSTASPDFAPAGVLDRFGQVNPRLLLVGSTYTYGGRTFDMRSSIPEVLAGLADVERVVVIGDAGEYDAWATWASGNVPLVTTAQDFDHPGFILFSSGTTGAPKCIVHGAAGVMIKDLVEQRLHLDIRPGDRVCYYTTAGWMMWNWLVMVLGTGATVVLFDGQPMFPETDRLLRLAEDEQLTFLGVSAKYIESLREKSVSSEPGSLAALRTIASTGSPLAPELFDYVYEHIDAGVHLASISGGTDICGCFVLGVPTEPVRRGEIQGPALGMNVQAFDESGTSVPVGTRGELVCTTPFPSRPIGFWGDDGTRFRSSYFERFPGVWAHGDFISRTDAGGFVIHGRSDATLNSGGVRIGTAEIYRVVDALDAVSESIVVGQRDGLDTRIVLFVVLTEGYELDDDLRGEIKRALRTSASPRHVPAEIVAVPAVPRTVTGKLAELAVTDIVNGDPVRNTSGLADATALRPYEMWAGRSTNDAVGPLFPG
jgi:acetoacetyl-CoA synthetase